MIVELQSVASNHGKVRRIRMNNDGEFVCKNLLELFVYYGITPEYSRPYDFDFNGRAKRLNWTLLDKAKIMVNGFSPAHNNL